MINLSKLTNIIGHIESEFNLEGNTITGMNGLLKAMQKVLFYLNRVAKKTNKLRLMKTNFFGIQQK